MRNYSFCVVAVILAVTVLGGCGGGSGGGGGSMMLNITGPSEGAILAGNQTVTAEMLNPAMANTVSFRVNGTEFYSCSPAQLTMQAPFRTLGLGLADGPATIVVTTSPNVYTATRHIIVSNDTSLFIPDASGQVGTNVTVHVRLNDISNTAGLQVHLTWNPAKLTFVTCDRGTGVPVASWSAPTHDSDDLAVSITGAVQFTTSEIFTVTFQIRNPSPVGTLNEINMNSLALSDTSGDPIACAALAGGITTIQ